MSARPRAVAYSFVSETGVPPGVDAPRLQRLVEHTLSAEGAGGDWEVTVALVDDARLQALHRTFMGLDTPTDIMTFPIGEGGGKMRGGELVISVDHALTQADAWDMSPAEEIEFLVIHGLLHLLGWRDDTEIERDAMMARQEALFQIWRSSSR
jgi:probable rRNA maturation factor